MEELDTTPHSLRSDYHPHTQSGLRPIESIYKNSFERNDEQLIWRIEVPGLTRADITLDVINQNELRFTAPIPKGYSGRDRQKMVVYLAKDDVVDYVDLSLGVLTITINRNLEIVPVDIESND